MLVGGEAAGAWEARFSGKVMEIRLDVFECPGACLWNVIRAGFDGISAFLGAREVRFS